MSTAPSQFDAVSRKDRVMRRNYDITGPPSLLSSSHKLHLRSCLQKSVPTGSTNLSQSNLRDASSANIEPALILPQELLRP
jgi:hypothetical protein